MSIGRFFLQACVIAIVLVGLSWAATTWVFPEYNFVACLVAVLLGLFGTVAGYALSFSGLDKATKLFMGMLFTGMMVKMLLGIIAVIVVAKAKATFGDVVTEFVVAYFVGYFVFTAFEVYALLRKLRPNFLKG